MKNKIINALIEMGVPADVKGFNYIVQIICLYDKNEDLICGKMMKVYQEIAERNNTTVSKVERALRHAFSIAQLKGDFKMVEKYLTKQHQNNGTLLAILYYRLKMEE